MSIVQIIGWLGLSIFAIAITVALWYESGWRGVSFVYGFTGILLACLFAVAGTFG